MGSFHSSSFVGTALLVIDSSLTECLSLF
uniref:Uncharacterized protein n=1 Tax=Rhizophora mucronata TaxID=61149 RepID=A0A2P2N936_RHIMU